MRKAGKGSPVLIACLMLLVHLLAASGVASGVPDSAALARGLVLGAKRYVGQAFEPAQAADWKVCPTFTPRTRRPDQPTIGLRDSPTISNVRGTNVSDKSFSVSWFTDVPANGQINYGTTPALGSSLNDDLNAGPYAHHVTLGGLLPNTTYYFDVVSNGATDDNGGAHYSLSTGPTLAIPSTDTIYGQVFQSDGVTPAQGAIVYVTLMDRDSTGSSGRSARLSALVDSVGYWNVNLAGARTTDYNSYFAYSAAGGDDLYLRAQGGPLGVKALVVDVGQSNDAEGNPTALPDLVLCVAGAVDGDSDVDVADIQLIAGLWKSAWGDADYDPTYDVDDDGDIDIVDIQLAARAWGSTC